VRFPPHLASLALAAAMIALPCADAPAADRPETTLTVAWPSNVGPLNPHLYSPNQMFAQAMVYESLVRYRADGSLGPWLATSWTISPDGRVYTFVLRPGVRFSDGVPFDAAAVKKNFDAILANAPRHAFLELIAQIDRVEAVDPLTVRLTLKQAYYPTLHDLAVIRPVRFLSPAAMPESGNTADGIKAPVGTGPWILSETRLGEYDLFRANPDYWGEKPKFDRLKVRVLPDINTRAVALETGEVDLVFGSGALSGDTFARFRARPDLRTSTSQPMATQMITLNSKRPPTDDLAVRRAVLAGVDRAAILTGILYDMDKPAEALFMPNAPYADIGLKAPAFDRQAAAKLLDDAGWTLALGAKVRSRNGKPLAIDLAFVGNNAKQKAISETVQADLARIGIRVVLVGEEENSIYARQRDGRFGMIFGDTWGAPYDPHAYLSSMRAPSHADYQAQLGLPMKAEIDAKISRALVSTDDAERRALFRWVLTTLHEQAVYLPVSYSTLLEVHRPTVENVGFSGSKSEIPFEAMTPAAAK
jgi:nickel transport system substrate-binding protein